MLRSRVLLKTAGAVVFVLSLLVSCGTPVAVGSSELRSGSVSRATAVSPVSTYGALSVSGNKVVGSAGQPVQLKGMSLFWSQWSTPFWTTSAINGLIAQTNLTLIRAAMGVESGGYLANPDVEKARVSTVVDAAVAKGIYVIIDWHDHNAIANKAAAKGFFQEMAVKYGKLPNVMFELFNEPDNESWPEVKAYAEEILATIRAAGSNNLVIVGTPTWSQDVDIASRNPITAYSNVAYTLHFYAGSHRQALRDKASTALANGAALFVTEWGVCDASGNGGVDLAESQTWINFMNSNGLSWANWAVNDKAESASAFVPGVSTSKPAGPWVAADLTQSGAYVLPLLGWPAGTPVTTTTVPVTTTTVPVTTTTTLPAAGVALPGKVTASAYTAITGTLKTEVCTDLGGGLDVGYTSVGGYLRYAVNVAVPGAFQATYRVASAQGGSFDVLIDGAKVDTIAVPNTGGWQSWVTLNGNGSYTLSAGAHTLQITVATTAYNLNWITFTAGTPVTTTTVPVTTTTVPVTTTTTVPSAGLLKVGYVKNDWGTGFSATITLTNTGTAAVSGWKLAFSYTGNQVVTNPWSATVVQTGKNVVVTPLSYNTTVAPGTSITIGFNANYSGTNVDPVNFTVTK